jgi:molybdopterin/thiamine biosynthesis adenylyltransferase
MNCAGARLDIADALRKRGFNPRPDGRHPSRGLRPYLGMLLAANRQWHIEVLVWDVEFLTLPTIRILDELPKGTLPHVNSKQELCYLISGSIILDLHNPGGSIALCLELAAKTLNSILTDPVYCRSEIRREFLQVWIHDFVKRTARDGTCLRIFDLAREPELYQRALPCSLIDVFELIDSCDREAGNHIYASMLSGCCLEILFRCQQGFFGFRQPLWTSMAYLQRPRCPLRISMITWEIMRFPMPIIRTGYPWLDSKSIYSRNTVRGETLIGKKISIVGVGALGGQVAMSLGRLGAGQQGGRIRLIDPGVLMSENIGRHYLGQRFVGQHKVEGIACSLRENHDGVVVDTFEGDARDVADLFKDDLVLNVTGEQMLSSSLNRQYQLLSREGDPSLPPFIHGWIKGAGQAVQALWVTPSNACFDCLFERIPGDEIADRYPVLKERTELRKVGCDLVSAYNDAAPLAGAALVTQMVSDWLRGVTEMATFRTIYLERSQSEVALIPDMILTHQAGCPSCSG